LRDKFQKRCNKLWQQEKEEVLEILYDFEYPNLTTKSAKVFSNPASILHVLSDAVHGDIFSSEHVVSVVDGIMEGSNSMVFDLTDDLVEHINTNPRLSRPGNNKVKLGLSRRPRVDRSPSRAAAQGGYWYWSFSLIIVVTNYAVRHPRSSWQFLRLEWHEF
jgi:hypothetical protein